MDKKAFTDAQEQLDSAQFSLENMIDEMQENYHNIVSDTASLRRTLRAVQANLKTVEKSQQQPTP